MIKTLDNKCAIELIVRQQRLKRIINHYDEQPTILIGEQRTNKDSSIPTEIEAFVNLPKNI